jgi:hypothetical protein
MNTASFLRVARAGGRARVDAGRSVPAGTVLLNLKGKVMARPNRYSIQIGRGRHLMPDGSACVWQFLNHSCEPNAAVVGRKLVAIRAIAAGDEVTFNYNCNEYDMDAPFRCRCGHCDGVRVRGYRYLSAAERERLGPYVAAHVRHERTEATPAALAVHA